MGDFSCNSVGFTNFLVRMRWGVLGWFGEGKRGVGKLWMSRWGWRGHLNTLHTNLTTSQMLIHPYLPVRYRVALATLTFDFPCVFGGFGRFCRLFSIGISSKNRLNQAWWIYDSSQMIITPTANIKQICLSYIY